MVIFKCYVARKDYEKTRDYINQATPQIAEQMGVSLSKAQRLLARTVRQIYTKYAGAKSVYEILQELNKIK